MPIYPTTLRRIQLLFAFHAVLILAGGSVLLRAQTITATLTGVVQDASGAVVPGAELSLTNAGTGFRRQSTSAGDGAYRFVNLEPGAYVLSVSAHGFKAKALEAIVLQVHQNARLDVPLEVGEVTTKVQVTANVSAVNTESANIGQVIDHEKVLELPLNGRQFLQLALLTPGTTPMHGGNSGRAAGGPRGLNVNIAGREDEQNFLIDGIESFGYRFKNTTIQPSIEDIQEFKIEQAPYDVRFGGAGYGQVNLVTASGSNTLHGNVYEFLRNDVFDARNFFDPKKPAYRQNQFGGVIGGPIVKDRAFYFFNYEGLRIRQGLSLPAQVPTALERSGNFSADPKPIIDPTTNQPFQGNIIPDNRIPSISKKFLDFFPLPNTGLAAPNFINNEGSPLREDEFTGRIDYSVSDKWRLYGRYIFQDTTRTDPDAIPTFGIPLSLRGQNLVLSATYSASPTLLMEVRLGYNREHQLNKTPHAGKVGVSAFGIPGLNTPPPLLDGIPAVSIQGFNRIGDQPNFPEGRSENTESLIVDFTKIKGRHTVVWGSFFRPVQLNAIFVSSSQRGSFTFNTNVLGGTTGLPSFLLGYPFQTGVTLGQSREDARGAGFAFYGMDTFRVTKRLTLAYGMRYELRQPWIDKQNRTASVSIVDGKEKFAGDPNNGFAGRKNRSLYDYSARNFGPRVSLALDPFGDGKTSIRTGYGIYYNQAAFNGSFLGAINPPFATSLTFTSVGRNLTWDNAFPSGRGITSGTPLGISLKPDYRDAIVQHWSFAVSRQLAPTVALETAYVGSKGDHLDSFMNMDQGGLFGLPAPYKAPFPQWIAIFEFGDRTRSTYNSLQTKVTKTFSHGLTGLFSYTYGHAIDNAAGVNATGLEYSGVQDTHNLRAERASSQYDVKHRAVASWVYELPLGAGKRFGTDATGLANKFLGGWGVSGIWAFQTGFPSTASISGLRSGTLGADRPNCVSNPTPPGFVQTREKWFDTNAFAPQPQGTFGNCGRATVRGAGLDNLDFNVFKNTHVNESVEIQFRAEFFNLWNHPNFCCPQRNSAFSGFSGPGMTVNVPATFGVISSAGDPRIIQFGLKFVF